MERGENARTFEDTRCFQPRFHRFQLAARAVDQDVRYRNACRRQFLGHLPGFHPVLDQHLESELALQPQHGHNIVGAVSVEMDQTLAGQDFAQRLFTEIDLLPVSLAVTLCLGESRANQRSRFRPCPGKAGRRADRIGPVGHLEAAHDRPVGEIPGDVLDRVPIAQTHVEGLAAYQPARAGHDIGGGDAARARLGDTCIFRIDRVHRAHVRLDGRRAVSPRHRTDMRMRIDDTRHNDHAAGIASVGIGRHGHVGAHGHDPAILDHQCAVFDHRPRHGVDRCTGESRCAILRSGAARRASQDGTGRECGTA